MPRRMNLWYVIKFIENNGTERFKHVSNCWNTQITFFFETSGGERCYLYLNAVYIFNTLEN